MKTAHYLPLIVFLIVSNVCSAQNSNSFSIQPTGKIVHRSSFEIEASPWGIQFNTFPFHSNTQYEELDVKKLLKEAPVLIDKAADLGVKWVRVSVDWPSIEDKNGDFHFELLDLTLKRLKEHKIETYLCFHNGHPLYTKGLQNPMISKSSTTAWLNFVKILVKRYNNEVDYWEIWNEPNYKTFWDPEPSPEQYFELVKTTVPVIRENDMNCKILCGGMARFDVPFLRELFELGIADLVDVVQVHPYNEIPEACISNLARTVKTPIWYQRSSNKASELIEIVESTGKDIEIWQGECGYPSTFNSRGWNGNGPYSENIQAKWLLRRGLTDLTYGAKVSTYFVIREQTGINNSESVNSKGLMCHDSFEVKKGFHAYQNMCSALTGSFHVIEKGIPNVEIVSEGSFLNIQQKNFFGLKLKNDSGNLFYSYWLPVRIQDKIELGKLNLTLDAREFTNPALLNLLNGKIFKPSEQIKSGNKLILKGLPFADFPFIIIDN